MFKNQKRYCQVASQADFVRENRKILRIKKGIFQSRFNLVESKKLVSTGSEREHKVFWPKPYYFTHTPALNQVTLNRSWLNSIFLQCVCKCFTSSGRPERAKRRESPAKVGSSHSERYSTGTTQPPRCLSQKVVPSVFFYVPQFWQSFPQSWQSPKVTYIKKHPTKWNPFERFWTESVWNKINISSHSQITKTVSIKRAVYVLICSEDSVPELAPFEVKGKAPAVFMMPRFLTELKNNMVIGFLSSE